MAEVIFQIDNLMRQVFGISPLPIYFPPQRPGAGDAPVPYDGEIAATSMSEEFINSIVGTPVYDVVSIPEGKYSAIVYENGKPIKKDISYAAYEFPHTIMVDASRAKNVVETMVAGRDGSIKEYINAADWDVSIRGFIISENRDYPKEAVEALLAMCQLPIALSVNSKHLNQLGIYNVVVKNVVLNQMEGHRNVQPFELQLISDTAEELIILNGMQ